MYAEVINQSCAVTALARHHGDRCHWLAAVLTLVCVVAPVGSIDAAVRHPQKPGASRNTPRHRTTTNRASSGRGKHGATRQPLAANSAPKASSSRRVQQQAAASLPLDLLSERQRAKVASVTAQTTVFRRMPAQVVRCDPDMYLFLVEHPEVLANIWGLAAQQQAPAGIQEISLTRTGPNTLTAHDGVGTQGDVEILHRSHNKHLLYAEGAYDGPLFLKPVRGRGLLYLTTAYAREPDGAYYMTCQLDAFIALERSGTELLARTFSPVVGKVADTSFMQSLAFVQMLADISEVNPSGIDQLTPRLEHVDADVCQQFSMMASTAAARAEQRRRNAAECPETTPIRQARPTVTGGSARR